MGHIGLPEGAGGTLAGLALNGTVAVAMLSNVFGARAIENVAPRDLTLARVLRDVLSLDAIELLARRARFVNDKEKTKWFLLLRNAGTQANPIVSVLCRCGARLVWRALGTPVSEDSFVLFRKDEVSKSKTRFRLEAFLVSSNTTQLVRRQGGGKLVLVANSEENRDNTTVLFTVVEHDQNYCSLFAEHWWVTFFGRRFDPRSGKKSDWKRKIGSKDGALYCENANVDGYLCFVLARQE